MSYYLHVHQRDKPGSGWDLQGDPFPFKTSLWHGPYEYASEALEAAISKGYHKMAYTINIIQLGD
jgi:hypothetical protein